MTNTKPRWLLGCPKQTGWYWLKFIDDPNICVGFVSPHLTAKEYAQTRTFSEHASHSIDENEGIQCYWSEALEKPPEPKFLEQTQS